VLKGKANMTNRQSQAVERVESIVDELNKRVRFDLNYLADEFNESNLKDFEKTCYDIVDSIEKLEYLIKAFKKANNL
jgi:predicted nucleotide-binding protein (sugar kinase/HSP70/actin superfamily)